MEKGFKEIPQQAKHLRNSGKLRKVVAIQISYKLGLSKKYISLKPRGSEKVSRTKRIFQTYFL